MKDSRFRQRIYFREVLKSVKTKKMDSKHIIIVEDDRMLRTIFQMFIRKLGHIILGVYSNGADAIEACEAHRPDLVMMDIHIQGDMDGIQTAAIIKQKFNLPVVFLSSDVEETTLQMAIETNSYGYLLKPVNISTLDLAIEHAFIRHRYESDMNKLYSYFQKINDESADAVVLLNNNLISYTNTTFSSLIELEKEKNVQNMEIFKFISEPNIAILKEKINYVLKNKIRIEYLDTILLTSKNNQIMVSIVIMLIDFGEKNYIKLVIKPIVLEENGE